MSIDSSNGFQEAGGSESEERNAFAPEDPKERLRKEVRARFEADPATQRGLEAAITIAEDEEGVLVALKIYEGIPSSAGFLLFDEIAERINMVLHKDGEPEEVTSMCGLRAKIIEIKSRSHSS